MRAYRIWTVPSVVAIAILARSGMALADSKRSFGGPSQGAKQSRARVNTPNFGQSSQKAASGLQNRVTKVPNKSVNAGISRAMTPIPSSESLTKAIKPGALSQIPMKPLPDAGGQVKPSAIPAIPMPGLGDGLKPNEVPVIPIPGAATGLKPSDIPMIPLPGTGDGVKPGSIPAVPLPGGINPADVPLTPVPGPGGGSNPAPPAPPAPEPPHCPPYWPHLNWCWFAPTLWVDFGYVHCPVVSTYVEVETVVEVVVPALDLEFVAVELVDMGDLQNGLGPRYRVTFRNSSAVAIAGAFEVKLAVAAESATGPAPQVIAMVDAMAAGEIRSLDLRLPLAANQLVIQGESATMMFPMLAVTIDAAQQIPESDELDNVAMMLRSEIRAVDR